MINSAQDAQERVVLFVDLLGFASLTENHPLQLQFIKDSERPLANIAMVLSGQENPLTRTFTGFHRALKSAINLGQHDHPLTAITFSDSAYIATNHLYEAVNIASYFVQTLLSQRIPVRAGIAYGTFSAVRFRSDMTLEGGDHAAYFLGTGVVRAHAAETCGIKGIRILLHPSAAALLADSKHNPPRPEKNRIDHMAHFEEAILMQMKGPNSENNLSHFGDAVRFQLGETVRRLADDIQSEKNRVHYVECSPEEMNNSLHVQYEIDYWRFKPTAKSKAWHSLQDMWDGAPQSALIHYEATAQAINRMCMAQGEASLKNLRRRTLPHTRK
jgi:hypothetical protein